MKSEDNKIRNIYIDIFEYANTFDTAKIHTNKRKYNICTQHMKFKDTVKNPQWWNIHDIAHNNDIAHNDM